MNEGERIKKNQQ